MKIKKSPDQFIAGAPLSGIAPPAPDAAKTKPSQQTYLHIPISRELRAKLKSQAALEEKSLYDFCTEVLDKAVS